MGRGFACFRGWLQLDAGGCSAYARGWSTWLKYACCLLVSWSSCSLRVCTCGKARTKKKNRSGSGKTTASTYKKTRSCNTCSSRHLTLWRWALSLLSRACSAWSWLSLRRLVSKSSSWWWRAVTPRRCCAWARSSWKIWVWGQLVWNHMTGRLGSSGSLKAWCNWISGQCSSQVFKNWHFMHVWWRLFVSSLKGYLFEKWRKVQ